MAAPGLHVDGKFIRDTAGRPVILRGVSIADPKSLMFFKRERPHDLFKIMEIAALEWRASVIRLPVHPDGIDDVPGFEGDIKKYLKEYLAPAVSKAAELGVYAIIDLHLFEDYTVKEKDSLIREFWGIVAPYYRDAPHVLFELFNEPVRPDDWDTWQRYCRPWADMISKAAPKNILLVGGPRWCQNMAGAAKNPVDGPNIVYSAHCYPAHLSDFENNWGPLFLKYPVFFTEWGYEDGAKYPTSGRTSYFGMPFMKLIEARGCSWCAWCFDNDWFPKIFEKPWNLPEDGEGRMGKFVKGLLLKNVYQ
jgi:endoglucanase